MAHTALGHLEALKKKELVLAALTMTQEEFDKLAADRNELIFFFFLDKKCFITLCITDYCQDPPIVLPTAHPKCFTNRSPMCCANHGCIA
jgi:hypothetical protein